MLAMKKQLLLVVLLLLTICCTVSAQVWQPKAAGVLPANVNVFDVSTVGDQIIWAVCGDYDPNGPFPADVPIVLRSTDGGETWESKTVLGAKSRYSWDIHAFDANTACITSQDLGTGTGRGIFRTTDGGQNWTETLHHIAAGVWVHFFDGSEGVCINARNIGRTTDGGQTWTNGTIPGFQTGEGNILNNASTSLATLGDRLWFGTWKGRLFRSTNRGANWQVFNSGLGNTATILSIDFVDEQNGLALYYLDSSPSIYRMARSTDGGEHWTSLPNASVFSEIAAIPCTKTFLATKWWTQGTGTYVSSDLGQTWTTVQDSLELWAPYFASSEHGWAVTATPTGANPALYKWAGGSLDRRVYVNQTATGSNTGASWADAFTDLKTALAAAKAGDEIWVAEGTYRPDAAGGSQTATFSISKDLKLYGGFSGTECLLSERDIAAHPTVLSGDLNGDDVDDDFTQNRGDNVLHVVLVTAATTLAALLDGFSIQNGQADGTQQDDQRGAGLYAFGSLTVRNCTFRGNFAQLNGGGMIARNLSSLVGTSVEVSHCNFENNATGSDGGGLSFLTLGPNARYSVKGCQFFNNKAQSDGGGFALGVGPNGKGVAFAVIACEFHNNEAMETGGGAGIYLNPGADNAQIEVDSCVFMSNRAGTDGCGLDVPTAGKNLNFRLKNTQFESNSSENGYGTVYLVGEGGATGTLLVDSCHFENNANLYSGGLEMGSSQNGTNLNFTVSNSSFKNNQAGVEGGGLTLWSTVNAKANFTLENCIIEGNEASGKGGGIVLLPSSKDFHATLRRCQIVGNRSNPSGAAVYAHQYLPNVPLPTTASVLLENCLVASNGGSGLPLNWAAILADSLPHLTLSHCTVANHAGVSIALRHKSGLTLQNTIVSMVSPTHFDGAIGTDSTSEIASLGGNILYDGSLGSHATPYDFQNTDPLFAAPDDFHLAAPASPGIDKGVGFGNLPATDLDGNPRVVGCPDIGAYESAVVVSTDCVTGVDEAMANAFSMTISPNPAGDFLQIEVSEKTAAPLAAEVFDAVGQLVLQKRLATGQMLDLQGLAPGVFVLKAVAGEQAYAGRFVKQ